MANYPQALAQDAVCQSHTGHMTGLWVLPDRPLRLNTNEGMNEGYRCKILGQWFLTLCPLRQTPVILDNEYF